MKPTLIPKAEKEGAPLSPAPAEQYALSGAHMVDVLKAQKDLLQAQNTAHQIAQQAQAQIQRVSQQAQQKQQAFGALLSKLLKEYGCPDDYQFDDEKLAFVKPKPSATKK